MKQEDESVMAVRLSRLSVMHCGVVVIAYGDGRRI